MSSPFKPQKSLSSESHTRPTREILSKGPPLELPHERAAKLEAAAKRFTETHDERSYNVLYRGVQEPLEGFVSRQGIEPKDVKDVVIQVCIALWRQRDRFAGSYGNFLGFGFACARIEVMRWQRKESRWDDVIVEPAEGQETEIGIEGLAHDPNPEQLAIAHEALNALPPLMLMVVRERFEGWEWKEIAKRNGYSEVWLKKTYAEAVKRLGR